MGFLPITPYLTIPAYDRLDHYPENRLPREIRQETPWCRLFGCQKEDVFLGISVGELLDEYGVPYANEDYETTCARCFKVFGFKSIAAVRVCVLQVSKRKHK
jgi:hypothetical protein